MKKSSPLKPKITGGSEAQPCFCCIVFLPLGALQITKSEQNTGSLVCLHQRGVRWARCTLLCCCACYKVCHVLHYALGDLFPVKVLISPFFPKSGFNKMALMIEMCTARKLNYIHTWCTCKFSLSNKYCVPVANNVYWLIFRSRFKQEILTESVMLWMSIMSLIS